MEADQKSARLTVLMPLPANAAVDHEALAAEIAAGYPAVGSIPKVNSGTTDASDQVAFLSFDDGSIGLAHVAARLPEELASAPSIAKDDAAVHDSLADHASHLIIFTAMECPTLADRILATALLLTTVATLSQRHAEAPIYWSSAQHWLDPANVRDAAADAVSAKPPLVALVHPNIINTGRTENEQPVHACWTTGLASYLGHEIEFLTAAMSPLEMINRVMGAAQYALSDQGVFRDGHTVGISETEKLKLFLVSKGEMVDGPTISISV